ncbi:hypothetical protein ETAA8_03590 [Anatilimnocola aggregata]|uniref:Uncharacterized protein n=1 Tax=Anatilimnocola aggregata TaxID=2528021 RepID=A0A517Y4Y7_9BACT|nr:hypothetical protein [Anatilimnocola aggregata]QDU25295.1 hypothetical protein ETAA8_03590 [Anatilimnocola aggregata]
MQRLQFFAARIVCFAASGAALLWSVASAADPAHDLSPELAKIRAVQAKGEGNRDASLAMKKVSQADAAALPIIIAAMDGAEPLVENWIRAAAEAVAQKQVDAGKPLPVAQLELFLKDTRHSPRGRRLAFELIAQQDKTAPERLIPTLLNDPSLELRREAVAKALDDAAKISAQPTAVKMYQNALTAARDLDQIKAASAKLKDLGEKANVPTHMGFITTWHIVGPFDNVDDAGWDVAYPPEKGVDLTAKYAGQKEEIGWISHTSTDEFGIVDLTKALDKHKGAVAYAYTEFLSDKDQPADFRLGSINANKLWVNGKELTANHVYHAGIQVDQYNSKGELKAGKNTILIKVCQNEQKEMWAQDWKFQLRVCDAIGTAILSTDRPTVRTSALPGSTLLK